MNDVIDRVKELKETLLQLPEIKEYFQYKKLIEDNTELGEMRKQLARLNSLGKKEEYENLKFIYEKNPLVNNFNILKQEVSSLLKEVLQEIS